MQPGWLEANGSPWRLNNSDTEININKSRTSLR
jgi:hypothetical protein